MTVRYNFDLYPRTDPRDGSLVKRLSDLQRAEYRGEANGAGVGLLSVRGESSDGVLIDPLGLQYVRVVSDDTDKVVGGFFLDKGSFAAITKQNTRLLEFSGAGTLSYLDRETMWSRSYIDQHPDVFENTASSQPFDGRWRLWNQGDFITDGDFLGAALWRVIWEAQHFSTDDPDVDRPESAIPDVVLTFDGFEDTDGNPWTLPSGHFEAQVGESVYQVTQRLMQAGLYVEMDPDTFELRAWEAADHRRDRTGGAFGASVVRFAAGDNIKSDAKRKLTSYIQRTAIQASTTDDLTVVVTGSGDIPWHSGLRDDVDDLPALEQLAASELARRADAGDVIKLRMRLGADPSNGFYRPWEEVLPDDIVTVDSGSDQWDWDEQDFPVAALEIKLREEGDWDAFAELGASFSSAPGREFHAPPSIVSGLRLCDPAFDCNEIPLSLLDAATATNGDAENGSGTEWSGGSYSTAHHHAGAGSYTRSGDGTLIYTFDPSQVFTAGVRYVIDVWSRFANDHLSHTLTFGVSGDEESRVYPGAVGDDPAGLYLETDTGNDGDPWLRSRVCWIPAADRTGVRLEHLTDVNSGSWYVDDLRLYTTDVSGNAGTESAAARCDHRHHATDIDGLTVGGGTYTDEQAQDAVGAMVDDTATVALVYTDATPSLTANVIPAGIKLDDLGTPDDNTDLNATSGQHGLLRKLSGSAGDYLDGSGAWSTPPTGGVGGSGIPGGSSFPGSPSSNDLYYRTDRDLLYFYDGTRWLTITEYELILQANTTSGVGSDSQSTYFMPIRADGDTFLTKYFATTFMSSTPAVWQVELYKVASASLAETLIASLSTSGDTAATGTRHETDIDALVPNGTFMLLVRFNEISGSANFTGAITVRYRRVG